MREKRQEGNFREGKERGKERKIVMEGRIIVTWGSSTVENSTDWSWFHAEIVRINPRYR